MSGCFAITREDFFLSPQTMRFGDFWIYDLGPLHPDLQKQIQNDAEIITAPNVWAVLHKIQNFHFFTDLNKTRLFLETYIEAFYPKYSKKSRDEPYRVFERLGLRKIGHLQRFCYTELHQRFNKGVAEFFYAFLKPDSIKWIWQPYRRLEVLHWQNEFEQPCVDSETLEKSIHCSFIKLLESKNKILFKSLKLYLISAGEEESDRTLEFDFTQTYNLSHHLSWLLRLIQERLFATKLDAPIFEMKLEIFPEGRTETYQLALFKNKIAEIEWKQACEKLKDSQFQVFQPEVLPSYLPEKSWKKVSPLERSFSTFKNYGLFRPLIQKEVQALSQEPASRWFTERLSWYDDEGRFHQRDYFITYQKRAWHWVFMDEENRWWSQGILE